ncbi:MAG: hypothetical protein SOW78_02585 [Clostridia bacterium]|nr:hypothetical protein [Clostridia bacterium]
MAEKEYIEREEAKKVLADDYAYNAAKLLDTVPTADVQVVRHEKWLYEDADIGWTEYKCSDCGNIICTVAQDEDLYSYCPYCGAKMDKT